MKTKGAPRKLESERQRRKIINALCRGVPITHAGGAAGVVFMTLRNEMLRDPEFAARVELAQSQGDYRLVRFLEREALKDGKLALAVAKARLPAYQQQKNVIVEGHVEHTHTHVKERRHRAAEFARRFGIDDLFGEAESSGAEVGPAANGHSNGNGKPSVN